MDPDSDKEDSNKIENEINEVPLPENYQEIFKTHYGERDKFTSELFFGNKFNLPQDQLVAMYEFPHPVLKQKLRYISISITRKQLMLTLYFVMSIENRLKSVMMGLPIFMDPDLITKI